MASSPLTTACSTGLGTFAGLDGGMVVLDGINYQVGLAARAGPARCQGAVRGGDPLPSPAAPGLEAVASLADLQRQLDLQRGSDNEFLAVRIEGCFERPRTRTVSLCSMSRRWRGH